VHFGKYAVAAHYSIFWKALCRFCARTRVCNR
jgi:hypothetical protein